MNKRLVNLTPHTLNVFDADGNPVATLLPDGTVARVSVKTLPMLDGLEDFPILVNGVPLFYQEVGEVAGLPAPVAGVLWVVSALVRLAVPSRTDVLSPGELKRNADGQPVGCVGLVGN